MDADGMDYPNGSELGEIFAALESLKQELQMMKEPMGTADNPARSCRDLWLCHPDYQDGTYYIDPNGGCAKDAIEVYCNMKEKGSTCVNPSQNSAKQNRWIKETPGSWFSEYSKGFQIDYNVTDPQFKFLRLLSSRATQQFVYECSSSVGWFDDLAVTTINLSTSRHTMMISLDIHQMRPDLKLKTLVTLVIRTDELQSSSIQERLTFSQSRISELLTLATSKSDLVSPLLKSVSTVKIAMHRIRQ